MYKIAIVDDEKDILDLLERFFSRKFEVSTFLNPLEADKQIRAGKFDLVLCDIMMPQINGLELLKQLHEDQINVKCIIMTAYDTIDKALDAHKYGAVNYFKKPFEDLKAMEQIVLEALE